ncbi:MAG: DUF1704 domain-containing protein [Candidatus Marinimicrobia bacterium]|nr:DUF1704 domain-containing protein [Candidatus Neomarinimicrobiota bacterium]MCH7955862.1 DUF1704 domain-containing protein [Candidatus Neomarinimicrobiota bacterium]
MKKKSYRRFLRRISIALIKAQKPIRILSSIHIPNTVKKRFLSHKKKRLPKYEYPPLRWSADQRRSMFFEIQSQLDSSNPVENIIRKTCEEYLLTIKMLESRGTADFYKYSKELYGYPDQRFVGGKVSIYDLAMHINDAFEGFELPYDLEKDVPKLNALAAKTLLSDQLRELFPDKKINVIISNRLTADAAAGADYVKLRKGATYTHRQIEQLVRHEGEVHIATTLNGASQPILKFLSKGTPRTTVYQEGLAVFAEFMSQQIDPVRVKRLAYRTIAIKMCEDGADFIDLFNYYLEQNFSESDAFDAAARCIRGGLMRGGAPFTKDVSYLDGFVKIYHFVHVAMKKNRPELVRFLFAGKLTAETVPIIYDLSLDNLVREPKYLPDWVRDTRYLLTFFNFSAFMDLINLSEVEEHYEHLMN